jgi:hypothetical protein
MGGKKLRRLRKLNLTVNGQLRQQQEKAAELLTAAAFATFCVTFIGVSGGVHLNIREIHRSDDLPEKLPQLVRFLFVQLVHVLEVTLFLEVIRSDHRRAAKLHIRHQLLSVEAVRRGNGKIESAHRFSDKAHKTRLRLLYAIV